MNQTDFYIKIRNLIKFNDPIVWWQEYPPRFIRQEKLIDHKIIKNHLQKIFNNQDHKIGLYIHIPFCEGRCLFCKYYLSSPKINQEIDNYLDCLEKELQLYEVNFKKTVLNNIYIGGGTPTILGEKQLIRLFEIINKFFAFKKGTQILTEGTPETLTYYKLKLLKNLGVTRFTIGAQSFNNPVLKMAHSRHTANDIYFAYKRARRAGIKYINLDLIIGLPGESLKTYLKTLQAILKLKPESVSLAPLDIGKGVAYSKQQKDYLSQAHKYLKNSERQIFSIFLKTLKAKGYKTIAGYPRSYLILKGNKKAANQSLIGRLQLNPMFGVGCGAISFLKSDSNRYPLLQYQAPTDLVQYQSQLYKNRLPKFKGLRLSKNEAIRKYLIYSFSYKKRVDKKEFFNLFRESLDQIFKNKFKTLVRDRLIFERGNKIFLSSSWQKIIKFLFPGNFENRDLFFFFCLKYFYSPSIIRQLKII